MQTYIVLLLQVNIYHRSILVVGVSFHPSAMIVMVNSHPFFVQ